MPISTPRLDLHDLPLELMRAVLARDWAAAAAQAPYPVDERSFTGSDHVLGLRIGQLERDPTEQPWLYRAAVLRETGRVIGRAGFQAPPDDTGTVEIGYEVLAPYRGQGLAAEMAVGLMRWGAEHGATACLASIRPDNAPSLALTARLGFVRIGQQLDDIDGLEWVFRLTLNGTLPSYDDRR